MDECVGVLSTYDTYVQQADGGPALLIYLSWYVQE